MLLFSILPNGVKIAGNCVFLTYIYNGFFRLSHVWDDPIRDDEKDEVFRAILY